MFENPIKLQCTRKSGDGLPNVFFMSDSHFNHKQKFIYEKRGFADVDDHKYSLIELINNTVGENDILIHTGDFCLNTTYDVFLEDLELINCHNIHYIWGNHNSCIRRMYYEDIYETYRSKHIQVYPRQVNKILYQGYYAEYIINGQCIVVCHYPIHSWNTMRKGSWMIHGHEHCAVRGSRPDVFDEGKILDVGVDLHHAPYSFAEVKSIMDKKQLKSVGHH